VGGGVTLRNHTEVDIGDWSCSFAIDCDLGSFSVWSAAVQNSHFVPPSWGATIPAGGTYAFGYSVWGSCAGKSPHDIECTGGPSPPPPPPPPDVLVISSLQIVPNVGGGLSAVASATFNSTGASGSLDWGDGTSVAVTTASPIELTHAYGAPGRYAVTLSVTQGSLSATATLEVVAGEGSLGMQLCSFRCTGATEDTSIARAQLACSCVACAEIASATCGSAGHVFEPVCGRAYPGGPPPAEWADVCAAPECGGEACACASLGVAGAYNVFAMGDLTASSSGVGGRMASGGNASLASYSVGAELLATGEATLVVGGDLTFTAGSVHNGAAIYGGTASLSNVSGDFAPGTAVDFAAAGSYLRDESRRLSAMRVNGAASLQYTARCTWGVGRPT
jgi:hypothetical protein